MIVVTGGAGFVGSVLAHKLCHTEKQSVLIIDDFGKDQRWQNLVHSAVVDTIAIKDTFIALREKAKEIRAVFHMGACSSTTEADMDFLLENNARFSARLFEYCAYQKIPYIYASSAATYGGEEKQFDDSSEYLHKLRPINKYGYSKHIFDLWARAQTLSPPFWAGLKFFNVFGPNEYHKGGQASVVFHAFHQIQKTAQLNLFKSYRADIKHGQQMRDFIYVEDVVDVMLHLWRRYAQNDSVTSGIYNVGTGTARSFEDLGYATFKALGQSSKIHYIEMPEGLASQYQYFTQANLTRLRNVAEYKKPFSSLEESVAKYVTSFLAKKDPYFAVP